MQALPLQPKPSKLPLIPEGLEVGVPADGYSAGDIITNSGAAALSLKAPAAASPEVPPGELGRKDCRKHFLIC